jgi:hypothetical protein
MTHTPILAGLMVVAFAPPAAKLAAVPAMRPKRPRRLQRRGVPRIGLLEVLGVLGCSRRFVPYRRAGRAGLLLLSGASSPPAQR